MYLRNYLTFKWIPLVKKDKCEKCGSTEKLEVHHNDKYFIEILDETLDLTGLDYKDTDEYTKKELELIKLVFFAKHFDMRTQTLCEKCHEKMHTKRKKKTSKIKRLNRKPILLQQRAERLDEFFENMQPDKLIKKAKIRELLGINTRKEFIRIIKFLGGKEYLAKKNIYESGHCYIKKDVYKNIVDASS